VIVWSATFGINTGSRLLLVQKWSRRWRQFLPLSTGFLCNLRVIGFLRGARTVEFVRLVYLTSAFFPSCRRILGDRKRRVGINRRRRRRIGRETLRDQTMVFLPAFCAVISTEIVISPGDRDDGAIAGLVESIFGLTKGHCADLPAKSSTVLDFLSIQTALPTTGRLANVLSVKGLRTNRGERI
jgi:hypothetical protein